MNAFKIIFTGCFTGCEFRVAEIGNLVMIVEFYREIFMAVLLKYGPTIQMVWVNIEQVSSTMMKLLNDRF